MDLSRIPFVLKVQSEIMNYLFGSSKVKNNPTVKQFISHLNARGSPIIQNTKDHDEPFEVQLDKIKFVNELIKTSVTNNLQMYGLLESIVYATLIYFTTIDDTVKDYAKADTTEPNLNVQANSKDINFDSSNTTSSSKPLLISNISKLFDSNDWMQKFLDSAKDLLANDKFIKQVQNITPHEEIGSQRMIKRIEQFWNEDDTPNNSA